MLCSPFVVQRRDRLCLIYILNMTEHVLLNESSIDELSSYIPFATYDSMYPSPSLNQLGILTDSWPRIPFWLNATHPELSLRSSRACHN